VRSCWRYDALHFSRPPDRASHVITVDGVIQLAEYTVAGPTTWRFGGAFSGSPEELLRPGFQYLGFDFITTDTWIELHLPLWFVILIVGCCGYSSWLPWSTRFSLRTLLIGMAVVAVLLGVVVWAV
jgi:hypothetical protein